MTPALLAAAVLAATSAPDVRPPSLTSAEDNVAYAVAAICAPYVLDGTSAADVLRPRSLVQDDGWKSPTFDSLGARPVRVGFAGFVHVGVGEPGGRRCEVMARGADPQALRNAVLRVLRTRPEALRPARSRYLPGRWASEDRLCTAAGSDRPNVMLLMSAAHPQERDRIALLVTLGDGAVRAPSCDRDDAPANYRTLIPPGAPDPSPPPADPH